MIHWMIDVVLHLDRHLNQIAADYGTWVYGLLFLIIFAETGLVVAPFLPGDSLLFAVGALAATAGSPVNLPMVCTLLCVAAILGDAVNYAIGKRVGPKIFSAESSWLFNKKHLMEAHEFYERHGGKTIIIARFIPIVRTFAPFVAGIGQMTYFKFALYNVTGGILWVLSFALLGYWFGNLPLVKKYFSLVILGIIVVSVLPVAIELLRARAKGKAAAAPAAASEQ